MILFAWLLAILPWLILVACCVAYPLVLLASVRRRAHPARPVSALPTRLTVLLSCHNEEAELRGAIEALLGQRGLPSPLQVIVASDASTDGTDAVAREFTASGVALWRSSRRAGKTATENAARSRCTGDIVYFMDAASRPDPDCLATMLHAFAEPDVGVVSSCDVAAAEHLEGVEGAYVAFEMWLRDLESRRGGTVAASGSLFAVRRELFVPLADDATRDFASVLLAHHRHRRTVSVAARCEVRHSDTLSGARRRRCRTVQHGLVTLLRYRMWLRPWHERGFGWKLLFHKVMRWILPPAVAVSLAGWLVLALHSPARLLVLGACLAGLVLIVGVELLLRRFRGTGRTYIASVAGNLLAAIQGLGVIAGREGVTSWEPTRRARTVSDA